MRLISGIVALRVGDGGISLSLDLTELTRVHRANLIKQGYRPIYIGQSIDYSMMGLEKSMVEGSISLDRL